MAKVVYGDSVTGNTPVLIRYKDKEQRVRIDELDQLCSGEWSSDGSKEYYELEGCESWTELGWTQLYRVIRHNVAKKIYRVYTNDGHIDVTEDHSLLTPQGFEISPSEMKVKSRLLSTKYIDGDICHAKEVLNLTNVMVYDLTTKNHHFQAGPEGLIVHNTDSLFVEFNPRNPETGERLQGREARQATIDITGEAGHFITKVLAAPHDFEFDKAFDPLLMFSKKRYAGNMYEENADDYVHKYMGIALKRRDNAPIVKTIFGGAMKMLLDKRDVIGAFHFVKEKCMELVDGKVSLGQLTVTKSLRADYANPLSIAHKVLADRITERDPGNAPAAGDRIGYVYISAKGGQQAAKLQGDRIETPLYIKEHKLVPDYRHYIEHQLQNPISQAFALLLEMIPGFTYDILRDCPSIENIDKYLAFREAKAADLLFSDCLKRFESTSKRSAIVSMFGSNTIIIPTQKQSVAPAKLSAIPSAMSSTMPSAKPSAKPSTSTKQVVQKTMSSYLYDSFLVDTIKKKERAKAAKEKEEKKE
jgi:hypothetical protein